MKTSLRMYNAGARAASAWQRLFERVFAELRLEIGFVPHGWPDPIADLWARPDLCCDFMCGWPFARSQVMQEIAVPVPAPPRYEGLPRYCSEFLVREESGWTCLDDSFGHRFGWMAIDSQSGFNAARFQLSRSIDTTKTRLYREVVGPLETPARTLEALRTKLVDVVALDCFYLDLCRRHHPDVLAGLRCVATTPWTTMPLLVAAPDIPPKIVDALRTRLTSMHESAIYTPFLEDVLLARFAVPDRAAYGIHEVMAHSAVSAGYEFIR